MVDRGFNHIDVIILSVLATFTVPALIWAAWRVRRSTTSTTSTSTSRRCPDRA